MADWNVDDLIQVIWIVGFLAVFVPVSLNERVRDQFFRPSSLLGKTIFIAVVVVQVGSALTYLVMDERSLLGISLVGWGMLLLLGYFCGRAAYLFWVAKKNVAVEQTSES